MAAETAVALLLHHGPLALLLIMALNRLGLVPGGLFILLMVGAMTSRGVLTLPAAIAAAYVGTLIGDSALYAAGRYGLGWLRRGVAPGQGQGRAGRAVTRWGLPAVFLTRWLVPPLTIAVSLICGLSAFPYRAFALAGVVGNMLFALIFVGAGHLFGDRWDQALAWFARAVVRAFAHRPYALLLLALVVAIVLAYRLVAGQRAAAPAARLVVPDPAASLLVGPEPPAEG